MFDNGEPLIFAPAQAWADWLIFCAWMVSASAATAGAVLAHIHKGL